MSAQVDLSTAAPAVQLSDAAATSKTGAVPVGIAGAGASTLASTVTPARPVARQLEFDGTPPQSAAARALARDLHASAQKIDRRRAQLDFSPPQEPFTSPVDKKLLEETQGEQTPPEETSERPEMPPATPAEERRFCGALDCFLPKCLVDLLESFCCWIASLCGTSLNISELFDSALNQEIADWNKGWKYSNPSDEESTLVKIHVCLNTDAYSDKTFEYEYWSEDRDMFAESMRNVKDYVQDKNAKSFEVYFVYLFDNADNGIEAFVDAYQSTVLNESGNLARKYYPFNDFESFSNENELSESVRALLSEKDFQVMQEATEEDFEGNPDTEE